MSSGPMITINDAQIQELSAVLKEIVDLGFGGTIKVFYRDLGRSIQRTVEGRYKQSGPNTRGERFKGILASSAAARRSSSKSFKKKMSKIAGDIRLPISVARPLLTTSAAMTAVEVTGDGVRVYPTKDWLVYHHPTSYTGIGTGKALDRGGNYVSERDKENYIIDLRNRLDIEMDKRMARVRAKQ